MRLAAFLALIATAFFALADPARAETRLAIVFGLGDYNRDGDLADVDPDAAAAAGLVTDLVNARNDATDITTALRGLGFTVDLRTDATRETMIDAMVDFGAKVNAARARGDVTTFVFYAGHAIQVDGANFLIPAGARLPTQDLSTLPARQAQTLLETRAVSLVTLMDQLPADPGRGVNLVVLDACRNNPWDRRIRGIARGAGVRGLADQRFDVRRTLIAYSAQPGATASDGAGRNSPFTAALKTWIARRDLSVKDMFDEVGASVERTARGQVPWTNAPSLGRYCLAGCGVTSPTVAPPQAVTTPAPATAGVRDVGPFGLDLLHPLVRRAVMETRTAQREARAAAARAEDAERRAQVAAERARRGEAGTKVQTFSNGQRYEGEFSNGKRNGVGVYSFASAGTYSGDFRDDQYSGYGVFRDGGADTGTLYAGQFSGSNRNGFGLFSKPNGQRQEGQFAADHPNGYVWFRRGGSTDIFEGEMRSVVRTDGGPGRSNQQHGYGVLWSREGVVKQAGRWEAGQLVEPLAPVR